MKVTEDHKYFILAVFIVACITVGFLMFVWQTIQFYRTTHELKSLPPRTIQEVRIYPRVSMAMGSPAFLSPSNELVGDFFNAFSDVRIYLGSSKKVRSYDHVWFLEVETTGGHLFQIACSISEENVVYGELGRIHEDGKGGRSNHGMFQSKRLFQWYQQYSYAWLSEERDNEDMRLERME